MKNYYSQNKHCKCGKLISNNARYCISCHQLGKRNHNFIDGRKSKKNKCIDCDKELVNYRAKRCRKHCIIELNIKKWKKESFRKKFHLIVSNKAKQRLSIPRNNPNWIDGRSFEPYTEEFNDILKEQIRKRDNYKCQKCYRQEKELKNYHKKLDIHHIDYDKENCKKENLITLCKSCNNKVNYNRDYWYVYFMYIMGEK